VDHWCINGNYYLACHIYTREQASEKYEGDHSKEQ
jgi:hypothetical protein